MDPTGTLPNVTVVGLTLRVPEGVVPEFVAVVELPLALVTPVHPDWVMAANKIIANMKRARGRETLRPTDGIRARVACSFGRSEILDRPGTT